MQTIMKVCWLALLLLLPMTFYGQSPPSTDSSSMESPDERFHIGEVLFKDDFRDGLEQQWVAELEEAGKVEARNGKLIFDVPAGCTLWFKPLIKGPVMIEYKATVI